MDSIYISTSLRAEVWSELEPIEDKDYEENWTQYVELGAQHE